MRLCLEERLGKKLEPGMAVQSWLSEYAATVLRRTRIGDDGITPYERIKERRTHRALPEFGESIMYMPLKAAKPGNEVRYYPGIFLGVRERSMRSW